ncbi:MAG: 3'-5' exonuclease [Cytophagales bacterium]|nr:3'-5' exonuclease [Bernardetiaceae bacterium]MDW8211483.1 3'-5' exonuclease [Cytophagales bacterium]
MNLKLRNPLAFFDLETTGTNIIADRIVEIAIVKLMPNGAKIIKQMRINPTIPIPLEASLIHGIYDEDVKDKPTFKQVAKELANFLEGADLAGFSILKFDLPMLVEEFLRAGVDFDPSTRRIVDVQRIFHLMEPRTLSAAYKFYCGKELVNAHNALADAMATIEVLDAQVEHYKNATMLDKNGQPFYPVQNDIQALHNLTASSNMVDFAGRIILDEKGVPVFNFGKYKGVPVLEAFEKEPGYYEWMMKGEFPLNTKQKITQILLSQFNQKKKQ